MGMTRREMWVLAVGLGLVVVGGGLGVAGRRVGMGAEVVRWVGVVGLGVWCGMRRKLAPWIFVAMVAGAEVGFDAPRFAVELRVFSDIFLRLIKTIVAPLILATLVTGIAGHGDLKSVGRMGVKALVYFEVVTTLALVIGLVAINLTKAGVGLAMPVGRGSTQVSERDGAPGGDADEVQAPAPTRWDDFLAACVSGEPGEESLRKGRFCRWRCLRCCLGLRWRRWLRRSGRRCCGCTESLSEVMFRFTNVVMYFAPVGVGAAMAYTVGHMGLGVLVNLGKLLLTLYGALAAFGVLVLLPVALLSGCRCGGFCRRWRSRRRLRLRRRRARRRCRGRWKRWKRWGCRGGW